MSSQILQPASSPISDWDTPPKRPPSVYDYAYSLKDQIIGTDKARLIQMVEKHGPMVRWVWTPEHPDGVSFDQVDFLLPAYQKHISRSSNRLAVVALVALLVLSIAVIFKLPWHSSLTPYFAFPLYLLMELIWTRHQAKLHPIQDAADETRRVRFEAWIKKRTVSGYSVALFGWITLISIALIMASGMSSHPTGLMGFANWLKPYDGSRAPQWPVYLIMIGGAALWHFCKITEFAISPRVLPIVFLLSALIGNICSVLLFPASVTYAAFGGFLGLAGFLLVALTSGYGNYPSRLHVSMIRVALGMGILGTIGVEYFNNGTLVGGFLTGALLGYLLITKRLLLRFAGPIKWLAILSVISLYAVALTALFQILS